jgi:hypothetical protein
MFDFMKRRAFKKEFTQAVKDGVLSESERNSLSKHDVDQNYANTVRSQHYLKETASLRKQIEQTRRMSPEQEAALYTISERLGIEPTFDSSFQKYRELWAAEAGEQVYLSPVEVSVMLKGDEQCCFREAALWGQMKTVKTLSHYSGFSTSFRIMKGVSYRVGNVRPNYNTSEQLKFLGDGELYITNKRMFLDGVGRSTSITFNRILNVEVHSDGLEISKTSGANDFFKMTQLNSEYAYVVIQELNRV